MTVTRPEEKGTLPPAPAWTDREGVGLREMTWADRQRSGLTCAWEGNSHSHNSKSSPTQRMGGGCPRWGRGRGAGATGSPWGCELSESRGCHVPRGDCNPQRGAARLRAAERVDLQSSHHEKSNSVPTRGEGR